MKKDKAAVRYEIAGFADFGSHRLKSYFAVFSFVESKP